jgi:competence protein ComEC
MRKVFLALLVLLVLFRVLSSLKSPLEGKRIRLSGTLFSEPKEYGSSLLVRLHDFSFFVPQNPNILYGSMLTVEGVVKNTDLIHLKIVSLYPPISILPKIRQKILKTIRETLPEPESSVLAGATLGAPNIPKKFSDALKRTGTSHIVVASGGNLAILAGFLEVSLSKILKRKMFLPLIAFILLIYSALTGFGAPIVRALIMWLAIIGVQYTGRVVKPLSVLFVTVILMLLYKPLWIFDVSFQLSIGATTGILLFGNVLQKRLKKLPVIHESLAMSLSAQVGILPISLFVFHELNFLSPIWNALILWTVPYITIIGMVGSVGALLFEPLGKLVFFVSFPFCWYFVKIISL